MSRSKHSTRGTIMSRRRHDRRKAFELKNLALMIEIRKKKQIKSEAKKLASTKAPKDATYYQSKAYYFAKDTALDLKKVTILVTIEDRVKQSKAQSIADKAAFKETKTKFKAEHPQKTIVSTLPATKLFISKKDRRKRKKLTSGAPKAILLQRNAA